MKPDRTYCLSNGVVTPSVTIDGVKVGDNRQKVVEIYGYGSQSVEGGVTRLTYDDDDEKASFLILEIKGDRVQKIIVGTQLN